MDDCATTANTIAQLQAQLAEKECELQRIKRDSAKERDCLTSLISRFILSYRSINPELYARMDGFEQHAESPLPLATLTAECETMNALLTKQSLIHEQLIHTANKRYTAILQELTANKELPEYIRHDAELLLKQFPLTSMADYRKQHEQLLQLSTSGMQWLSNRFDTFNENPISGGANQHPAILPRRGKKIERLENNALSLSQLTPDVMNSLHEELQHLITELDFQGNTGYQLADIRRRLIGGISYFHLPVLALELISLVIDGVRKERNFSFTFIHSLSDKLKADHTHLQTQLDKAYDLTYHEVRHDQQCDLHIQQLKSLLDQSPRAEYTTQLQKPLLELEKILQDRIQLIGAQQAMLNQIAIVTENLKSTEDEVSSFKGKLNHFNQQLQIDTLTQLYNRTALHERLSIEYKRWLRYQTPLCLAIIDIDYFKNINDQYGHLAGDKALKVIARTLHTAFRETDFVARFGGEEFVVLLPGITHEMVDIPLNKLRQTVKNIPFRFKENEISITISIGATSFRQGDRISDVLDRADKALYQAKNNGRDRLVISL
jgi:diguanylate cyclase